MKRGISLLLMLLMLCTGCACRQTAAPAEGFTFTDDLGRSVTVSNPTRVAALLGSFAHIWSLAGGTVAASPDDAWTDFRLELPEDAVNLGMTKSLSLELLLAAEPDFILASTNTAQHREWETTFSDIGVPTAYFDVSDFDDYLRLLKLCTEITGRPELYEENGVRIQAKIDEVIARSQARLAQADAPTVLSLRASASYIRAKNSSGNVLGEMLRALGCVNLADSDSLLLEELSLERILRADPDFIFIVRSGDDTTGTDDNIARFLTENPAWNTLTAVREGRVFVLEKELYNLKPNDRWGEAYEKIEDILSGRQ